MLLRDVDRNEDYINSKCSAILVRRAQFRHHHLVFSYLMIRKACLPPQIGNRFAITAAHCLFDDDNEEVLPANMFSVMLGVHNRRVTRAPNR